MKKAAFWRKDDDGLEKHLRFVISDPDMDRNVLIVHMTKIKNNGREDLSCVLRKGEHRCLTDDSYIRYDKAFTLSSVKMLQEKFSGNIDFRDDISDDLLGRIQEGAKTTDALPIKFESFFDYF
jgi:hypothetical protein